MTPTPAATPLTLPPAAIFGLALLLTIPLLLRLAHPSLYADDVVRIAQLQQASGWLAFLFSPFNEHMAPLFQGVTWLTWQACGHSLAAAPLAFTISSALPHILTLILLFRFLNRSLHNQPAALVATAVFGMSGLITETHSWYSACSFSYALGLTLLAFDLSQAGRPWAAALAAFASPAFSAIGLLAGPLCIPLNPARPRPARSFAPLTGTAVYVAICLPFRYARIISSSVGSNASLWPSLKNTLVAPIEVLLPGLIGLKSQAHAWPASVSVAVALFVLAAAFVWIVRYWFTRPNASALAFVALGLIVGGYALAFGARSFGTSPEQVRAVQRYQLFPLIGAVMLLALGIDFLTRSTAFQRFALSKLAFVALAAVLALQWSILRQHARFYQYPEQPAAIRAMEHLAQVCQQREITRDQCLATLDPTRYRWFDFPFNALMMLPQTTNISSAKVTAPGLRAELLASLSYADREALFGGMDAQPQLLDSHAPLASFESVLTRTQAMARDTTPEPQWHGLNWGAYLEFEVPTTLAASPRLVLTTSGPIEIWWSEDGKKWSESRSLRWAVPLTSAPTARVLDLSKLPHWSSTKPRKLRLAPRDTTTIVAGPPRWLR